MRLPRPVPCLLALALVLAPPSTAAALDPVEVAAREEVTSSAAGSVVRLLAGPRFEGRGTLQKGNEEAARWLARELREAGIEPAFAEPGVRYAAAEDGYLQWFEVRERDGTVAGKTPNVVGILRGSGPAVVPPGPPPAPPADGAGGGGDAGPGDGPAGDAAAAPPPPAREYVVLGAHFDHLGVPTRKPDDRRPAKKSQTYFGADDNASGTAAVLLVARALGRMKKAGVLPRRDVVIAFFSGEERGLLGSRHYCASPPFPVADTVAMLNLDMVGRNSLKSMEVYGNTSSPELDAAHRAVLETTGFQCTYPGGDVFMRSDHYAFYEKQVPVLFFHGGLHKDYHTTNDLPDRIDPRKVERIARHTLGVLWIVAGEGARPTWRKVDMTGAGGRLGLSVDPAFPEEVDALDLAEDRSAVRVTAVFAGGLGEKFFEVGDVIFSWNGYPILADDPTGRFLGFVNTAKSGAKVTIRFLRGKEQKGCVVQF